MVAYPDFLFLVIDREITCMIFAEAYGELEQGRKIYENIPDFYPVDRNIQISISLKKRSGGSGRFSVTVDNCSATSFSINKILIFC